MEADDSVFIKIDKYKDANEIVKIIRARIAEGRNILGRINELKNREDQELDQWNAELSDVEKKVEMIDSILFEPEL